MRLLSERSRIRETAQKERKGLGSNGNTAHIYNSGWGLDSRLRGILCLKVDIKSANKKSYHNTVQLAREYTTDSLPRCRIRS